MEILSKLWKGFLFIYGCIIFLGIGAFFIALSMENPGFLLIPTIWALYYFRNSIMEGLIKGFSIFLGGLIIGGVIALIIAFPLFFIVVLLWLIYNK